MAMLQVNNGKTPTENPGFRKMFAPKQLTLGVFFPIEAFARDQPTMEGQTALAQLAERSGFSALWFRDVPLRDPNFGDIGQIYDPWVYLGYITAQTKNIALATGAIILPLRHPIHTAKAAASVDQLSGGRLVMGIASGDRAVEFPAFGKHHEIRGEDFREHFSVFKRLLSEHFPAISSVYGDIEYVDLIPKPVANGIPCLVTGSSRQSPEWIAKHSDGWITYPREISKQLTVVKQWYEQVEQQAPGVYKPFAQSYYIDLAENENEAASPIHLGHRLGRNQLIEHLSTLREGGVNHVIFNLKYGKRPATEVMAELAEYVIPEFPSL